MSTWHKPRCPDSLLHTKLTHTNKTLSLSLSTPKETPTKTTKMASSPTLLTPTSQPKPKPLPSFKPTKPAAVSAAAPATAASVKAPIFRRRELLSIAAVAAAALTPVWAQPAAAEDDEYVKETAEVISKVRATINMDKTDPNVAEAVAELRETSNSWVAKYRREKALLGRASFRDMYSALNAVSGHYISFGPTAPIPAKRKARILEEVDTAEKALLRGR